MIPATTSFLEVFVSDESSSGRDISVPKEPMPANLTTITSQEGKGQFIGQMPIRRGSPINLSSNG